MRKSTHSPEYVAILKTLLEMRKNAGMTQQQVADKLGREQSFVWRIEKGERRVDLLEFFWICNVLGYDAAQVYSDLCLMFLDETHSFKNTN
jgi:transcriptional regulator with XRE-family HTH domain